MEARAMASDRGRLRWRASRHALLELDLLFARFLERHFDRLGEADLAALEEMLALEDVELWAMVSGRRECGNANWKGLVELLRQY